MGGSITVHTHSCHRSRIAQPGFTNSHSIALLRLNVGGRRRSKRILHRFGNPDNPNAPMLLAIETFTLIRMYVGHLAQEIIVTFHFVSHHLTPFIPVLLYKTPLEDRCVRFLHRNARYSKPLVGCSFVSCKGGPFSMAQGTLANLSSSAFIRTPPLFAEWIVHHLLTFPAGETVTILDPTAGEGRSAGTLPEYSSGTALWRGDQRRPRRHSTPSPAICHHPYQRLRGHHLHAWLDESGAGQPALLFQQWQTGGVPYYRRCRRTAHARWHHGGDHPGQIRLGWHHDIALEQMV